MDLEDIKMLTKSQILSKDTLQEIFEEEGVNRVELLINLSARAKELKIKSEFEEFKKAFEKEINAFKKAQQEKALQEVQQQEQAKHTYMFFADEDDVSTSNTGEWTIDESGIYYYWGSTKIYACYYPVAIAKRFVNVESNKEEWELAWWKDNEKRTIKVARSVAMSATKIVQLSDYGFPVTSENARNLVRYLSEYEKFNTSLIALKKSTSKFGWVNGEKEFIPYDSDNIILNLPQSYHALTESLQECGEYDEWLRLVKGIRQSGRIEPLIYMAASFGSILLKLMNIQPFIVNLYGASGRGKTVNLMLCASIWGNPKKLISESTSTLNSFEQKLNVLNNLPMLIDDLSKIRDRGDGEKFTDFIYTLCSGQGKGRLSKDIQIRDVAVWNNTILTNIERPLANDTMQGGAINRVLDFEIQEGDIFRSGNEVVNCILKNYGHAGKIFVEYVKTIKDDIPMMVKQYEDTIKEIAVDLGCQKEQKQITPLAILLTADELAERYLFKDGIRLDAKFCTQSLKDVESVSEMERAWKNIQDEIVVNRMNYVPDSQDQTYRGKICGYYNGSSIAILPSVFREIAQKYNFNPKQFLSWANKHEILYQTNDKSHTSVLWKIPTLEKYVRCYVFICRDSILLDENFN